VSAKSGADAALARLRRENKGLREQVEDLQREVRYLEDRLESASEELRCEFEAIVRELEFAVLKGMPFAVRLAIAEFQARL
jgi:uncharacterized protein YlxW (UPF0749 family)